MHYFKTEWIILSKKRQSEKEVLYRILFKEYGILHVKKMRKTREKEFDIWYIISCEIITHKNSKDSIPSITNIKIRDFFRPQEKKYNEIIEFLTSINAIIKCLPQWLPHTELYHLWEYMLSRQDELTPLSHILLRLKIQCYNGELTWDHSDPNIKKILRFVQKWTVSDILRLKTVPVEIQHTLKTLL